MTPSIKLFANKEKIELAGRLERDGDYFYEGNDKRMVIVCEARETFYDGECCNKMMHGRGRFVSQAKPDPFVYEGAFFEGQRHGKGMLRRL